MDLQKLLNEMTVDEKLAQMTQLVPQIITDKGEGVITGPMRNFGITKKETSCVGTLLGASGAKQIKDLQDFHLSEDPHKIPLLFMADVIHGYRTLYPVPLGLGASFDVDLAEKCCAMAAKEASVGGIHVTFAPMIDLVRDARWGRCMETTGEDPYLNSKMSAAMVKGFQGDFSKDKIAACVKHFAAYGACDGGRDYDAVEMGDHTLREYYLPAYKAAVDAGVELVMTSFNTLNGIPSSANKYLVDDILRKEWGFDGIVISDFNASSFSQYDTPHNTDDADVQRRIARWAAFGGSTEHMFFAVCLESAVIGYVAFNIRENGHEIGYCFHSAYHGKGYAKESFQALFDYVRALGINKLTAGTGLDNTPSVALLKSLGFKLIETEMVSFYKDDKGNDIVFDGGVFERML